MGICLGRVLISFDPINDIELASLKEFFDMGFTKLDVDEFYTLFLKMDTDNSADVTIEEMLKKLHIEPTPFLRKAFSIMDLDHSGELNFMEFLCSLWNFLCLDDKSMGAFVFLMTPKIKNSTNKHGGKLASTKNVIETIKLIHYKDDKKEHTLGSHSLHQVQESQNAMSIEMGRLKKRFPVEVSAHDLALWCYEEKGPISPLLLVQNDIFSRLKRIGKGRKYWNKMIGYRNMTQHLAHYDYPFTIRDKIAEFVNTKIQSKKDSNNSQRYANAHRNSRQSKVMGFLNLKPKEEHKSGGVHINTNKMVIMHDKCEKLGKLSSNKNSPPRPARPKKATPNKVHIVN